MLPSSNEKSDNLISKKRKEKPKWGPWFIFGQIFLFGQSGYDPQGRFNQIWLQAKYESKTTSFIKSHFLAKILETM
jgi:hypothetical protein